MTHCHTLIATLRQRGYRVTPQREMVIEAIAHSDRHMTAEEVYELVRGRTRALNIATVYRTLELLVEEGLASRADLGGGQEVYATVRHGAHIHLVCRQCGEVIDADAGVLDALLAQLETRYAFTCQPEHFVLYGLCADCQAILRGDAGIAP